MSKVLVIEDTQRCRYCPIVVEFMGTWNCPITKDSNHAGQMCNALLDSDETFVKEHSLYKELEKRIEELESMGGGE
jgi:hypothetical protein